MNFAAVGKNVRAAVSREARKLIPADGGSFDMTLREHFKLWLAWQWRRLLRRVAARRAEKLAEQAERERLERLRNPSAFLGLDEATR